MAVLKLPKDDPEKELEFELEYQASLSVNERFTMLFNQMKIQSELLEKYGHRKPFEIIKRT